MKNKLIIIRGAGDLATGVIQKLWRAGFNVLALEQEQPFVIRRSVALANAMYEGKAKVEDMTAFRVSSLFETQQCFANNVIPIIVDPEATVLNQLKPVALVDAIVAKKNYGTHKKMAPLVVALGPGFYASKDCHVIVETQRGHHLGRLIYDGEALPNTGRPGLIAGESEKRVLYAPAHGLFTAREKIGAAVIKGQEIALINNKPLEATMDGILRGILFDGLTVTKGLKVADIDPRLDEKNNCFTISDKARAVGGAVLDAVLHHTKGVR